LVVLLNSSTSQLKPMKKIFLFFFLVGFCCKDSHSQSGVWTWINGSNISSSTGVYGTQGVPSAANYPPASYEYLEWKDSQGNFWLYGGCNTSAFSDLWKYDPVTNEWTWLKGNGVAYQVPVYGIKGIGNPSNSPGIREWCAATWVDASDNLWLFGGNSGKNDLWKFEIATGEWTWMSGDSLNVQSGIYGTQGIPSAGNMPGARYETCSAWTDSLNNLWLFGGFGYDSSGNGGSLNDLWKYDQLTNEWTWMKGSPVANPTAVYGTQKVAGPTNVPSGRKSYTKWKDIQGDFWLMGGHRAIGNVYLNDLWRYSLSTNEWTWMSGSNTGNDPGIYNSYCANDSINIPASRWEQRSAATDACGRFWLFGGVHFYPNYLNDLWMYDPSQQNWNWMSGTNIPNQPGNYGIKGVPSVTNIPPSRWGAIAWWGNDNKFYMLGGSNSNTDPIFSDLWIFEPDTNCVVGCSGLPIASFITSNDLCPGACTEFVNLSTSASSYIWIFPGAIPSVSTDVSPSNICYNVPGSYDVTLIASNGTTSDTLTLLNYITVYPAPPPQGILQSGDTLFANPGASAYQWFYNSTPITGATDYFYIATQNGNYNVVATDSNGWEAVLNNVIASLTPALSKGEGVTAFPNPVTEYLEIRGLEKNITAAEISVYSLLGEKIPLAVKCCPLTVDCRPLPAGMYYIQINQNEKMIRTKFVKSAYR